MNKSPKVSVVMPAYNAEKYIDEAVLSILKQSFSDFELIIVNDCSTDGTLNLIQKLALNDSRIKILNNVKNLQISESLNAGIAQAQGEYIVRMDADDWSYPDRIEKQVSFMDAHPDVGICGGAMEMCDAEMRYLRTRNYNQNDESIRRRIFRYSPFCHPATIIRTEVIRAHNIQYGKYVVTAEDYDIYFRIGMHAKFANLPDVVLKYRVLPTSNSNSKAWRQESLTVFIRIKAVLEYRYTMSFLDMLYLTTQLASMYIVPYKFKVALFNMLRG